MGIIELIQIALISWVGFNTIDHSKVDKHIPKKEVITISAKNAQVEKNVKIKEMENKIIIDNNECGTEIKKIFVNQINPKTGKPLEVCQGKLLVGSQKTRIVKDYNKGK